MPINVSIFSKSFNWIWNGSYILFLRKQCYCLFIKKSNANSICTYLFKNVLIIQIALVERIWSIFLKMACLNLQHGVFLLYSLFSSTVLVIFLLLTMPLGSIYKVKNNLYKFILILQTLKLLKQKSESK